MTPTGQFAGRPPSVSYVESSSLYVGRRTVPVRSRTRHCARRIYFVRVEVPVRSIVQATVLLLAATLPVAAQAPSESAQSSDSETGVFIGVGIGGGTLGVAGQLSLGAATSIGDFFVRAVHMTEVHGGLNPRGVHESSSDVGLLYGLRLRLGSSGWLRLAVGPAAVRTVFDDCQPNGSCNEWSKANTTGLAVQLDGALVRFGSTDIGVGAFGNLNADRSFWGVTLSLSASEDFSRPVSGVW